MAKAWWSSSSLCSSNASTSFQSFGLKLVGLSAGHRDPLVLIHWTSFCGDTINNWISTIATYCYIDSQWPHPSPHKKRKVAITVFCLYWVSHGESYMTVKNLGLLWILAETDIFIFIEKYQVEIKFVFLDREKFHPVSRFWKLTRILQIRQWPITMAYWFCYHY